jgi:hypothetical protein
VTAEAQIGICNWSPVDPGDGLGGNLFIPNFLKIAAPRSAATDEADVTPDAGLDHTVADKENR